MLFYGLRVGGYFGDGLICSDRPMGGDMKTYDFHAVAVVEVVLNIWRIRRSNRTVISIVILNVAYNSFPIRHRKFCVADSADIG